MRHAWLAAAGVFAAALIAGAATAQEPVKVKGDEELGKLTVKDTGEKVKVKKTGSKYKVKETGEKFKVKDVRGGEKVKGSSIKIKHPKGAGLEDEEAVPEKKPVRFTPRVRVTPTSPAKASARETPPAPAAR